MGIMAARLIACTVAGIGLVALLAGGPAGQRAGGGSGGAQYRPGL